MTDANHSPVSLPAGSYDYDSLKQGADKAAKGSAKHYDEKMREAVQGADTSAHEPVDVRAIAGNKFVDVENGLGGTESVQVFDQKLAEREGVDTGAIPEADLQNRQARTRADAAAKVSGTTE